MRPVFLDYLSVSYDYENRVCPDWETGRNKPKRRGIRRPKRVACLLFKAKKFNSRFKKYIVNLTLHIYLSFYQK